MKKIILAPDSFKGTMSSLEICRIMQEEIRKVYPACQIYSIPVADGGEGTVDSFLHAVSGKKIEITVKGPHFEDIRSFYGLIDGGKTAVIEMAAAAGLPLAGDNSKPMSTTTYGVGKLVKDAVEKGANKIITGIGGSCTNDGGCGMAAALGVDFFDYSGEKFIPTGGTLNKIKNVDVSGAQKFLENVRLITMCDVNNPLYGKNGAAYVFGPQKGADPDEVQILDSNLQYYGNLIEQIPGKKDVSNYPGAGAAGGLGAGMYALLNAELLPGINVILDVVHFDELLENCDLVFTGEGRIDGQSLHGKVISGIAHRAKLKKVPVCVVVGDSRDDEIAPAYEQGVSAVFSINRRSLPFSEAKLLTDKNLRYTMKNILGLISLKN